MKLQPKCHDFSESLRISHAAEDLPIWEQIYREAFRDFQAMHNHRQDGDHQRNGIDRSVVLTNGKTLWIDEKYRTTTFDDIALEFYSVWYGPDNPGNSLGWVVKSLLCDYIAYAIGPLSVCYLLPVPQLQKAWRTHGARWMDLYGERQAKNKTYVTRFCPVPAAVVIDAITDSLIVRFEREPT